MAQLDKETVENFIIILSKAKFDGICRIILSEYFHLDPVNVDRRGDGGGDWVTLPYKGGKRAFIAQATIQESDWKSKCLVDAEKAINNFKCTRYLFLTSRRRDSVDLLEIENQIQEDYDIPANCLGAVEIADILVSRNLTAKAFIEAGLPVTLPDLDRPDRKEILMFGALSIGTNAIALRDHVYDDAILCAVASQDAISREELAISSINMLQCGEHREDRVFSRIDSLLTRGVLVKNSGDGKIAPSEETKESLRLARVIYEEQLADLKLKIQPAFEKHGVSAPTDDTVSKLAIFASRSTILASLRGTSEAGVTLPNHTLVDQLGDPALEARTLIKEVLNISSRAKIDEIFSDVLIASSNHPLVLRLSHEVLFFALDGINPIHQAKALGIGSWDQAEAILDASVAIPFLCSKLTTPSSGRFSRGATLAVSALQDVGCHTFIPRDYLNEAAVHLLHAVDYCRTFPDETILASSPNGYVSHYYRLKCDHGDIPKSLLDFLLILSPSLRSPDASDIVQRIMNDIQNHLNEFEVYRIDFGRIPEPQISSASSMYAAERKVNGNVRETILVEHDTRTIGWMRKCKADGEHNKICLTWDKIMIAVSKTNEGTGWIITPHQISDLITMGSKRDEGALMTITHDLAAARTLQDDLVGRILDEAVNHAKAGRIEWKVINELTELRNQIHSQAFTDGEIEDEKLREIANEFWRRHGIEPNRAYERSRITGQDIKTAFEKAARSSESPS